MKIKKNKLKCEDCDGECKETANYICEDCGKLYCEICAQNNDFQCEDCIIIPNIIPIKKE
jgi:hypothetical protein